MGDARRSWRGHGSQRIEPIVDDGQVTTDPTPAAADDSVDPTGVRTRPRMWLVLLIVAAVVLTADLITKILAVALIEPGDPVEIIGDTVTFRLVRNSGAAFSMATGYTWILTIVALAVVVGIIRYSKRLGSVWWALGLGLVLGGALGNLIDRIFRAPGPLRGHVVDFMSVGWWPVFNIADSAVVCGAVLLVGLTLFGFEFDGTRTGKNAPPESEANEPGIQESKTSSTSSANERSEASDDGKRQEH
ncbi:signal peptidase II [Williamsia sp. 1138]|nr:signal peptidase II [Williamsia sp. 1138]